MGFNLGLAASAYQGMREEEQRIRDQEFQQAQRDYVRANMDAEGSLRGQRTAVAGQQLGLQGAQLDTAMKMQPGVEKLALTNQGLQQGTADNDVKNQPLVNATRTQQAETGLVDAGTARVQTEDKRNAAISDHNELAGKIEHAVANRQADREAIKSNMFGHLYADHPDGNFDDSVPRFQFAADKMPITYPELAGRTIGSVKSETGADGNKMLVVRDKDGQVLMTKSAAQMAAAYQAQGKTQVLADGANIVSVNGGRATALTSNTKTVGGGAGGGRANTQQERAVEHFIADAKAKGKTLTWTEAYQQVRSNPEGAAQSVIKTDPILNYDDKMTPASKAARINEIRASFGLAPQTPRPGLGNIDPALQERIKSMIGPPQL